MGSSCSCSNLLRCKTEQKEQFPFTCVLRVDFFSSFSGFFVKEDLVAKINSDI